MYIFLQYEQFLINYIGNDVISRIINNIKELEKTPYNEYILPKVS